MKKVAGHKTPKDKQNDFGDKISGSQADGRASIGEERKDGGDDKDNDCYDDDSVGAPSPDSLAYTDAGQDKLSLSRSSSLGSIVSTYTITSDKGGSSGCPTPMSEYLAFQQPFKSVSFSCGGWLQFYLFGVARAFQGMGIHKDVKWAGCSAGALAAAGIALDGDFDAAIKFCKKKCIPKTHHISGLFTLEEYVGSCIERYQRR